MNKIIFYIFTCVLYIIFFTGCTKNSEVTIDIEQSVSESITDEQAIAAIQNYCYDNNPDLESIVAENNYPVYWDISSSDEGEIVIIFRSYTGSQNRYYIDRNTGDTYVTEFIPGIMDEEERTGESFNITEFCPK